MINCRYIICSTTQIDLTINVLKLLLLVIVNFLIELENHEEKIGFVFKG